MILVCRWHFFMVPFLKFAQNYSKYNIKGAFLKMF